MSAACSLHSYNLFIVCIPFILYMAASSASIVLLVHVLLWLMNKAASPYWRRSTMSPVYWSNLGEIGYCCQKQSLPNLENVPNPYYKEIRKTNSLRILILNNSYRNLRKMCVFLKLKHCLCNWLYHYHFYRIGPLKHTMTSK